MEIISQIIISVVTGSGLTVLLNLWITERIKASIKSEFDTKLEFLKKDHQLEIAKFQSEIGALQHKNNFKFTKLHEKRMEVLETLYSQINNCHFAIHIYVHPMKQIPPGTTYETLNEELYQRFANSYNELATFFENNKIYFDDELEEMIGKYISGVNEIWTDFQEDIFLKEYNSRTTDSMKKAATAYKKVESVISPIRTEIKSRFRILLDVAEG